MPHLIHAGLIGLFWTLGVFWVGQPEHPALNQWINVPADCVLLGRDLQETSDFFSCTRRPAKIEKSLYMVRKGCSRVSRVRLCVTAVVEYNGKLSLSVTEDRLR